MKKRMSFLAVVIILLFTNLSIAFEIPTILINEFVTSPQTDWNKDNLINSNDEWIELYNPGANPVIIKNWKIKLIDSSPAEKILSGIIPSSSYMTLINLPKDQSGNGRIELYDEFENLIDSVTYGNYEDGNPSDNAPSGFSTSVFNECVSRFPNGKSTGIDSEDFIKTLCTFNSENNISFKPVKITLLPLQPPCALTTDNLSISADITGNITKVELVINTNGTNRTILFPKTTEGIYTHTILSSETSAGAQIEWQFIVTDIQENKIESEISSAKIHHTTRLNILPSTPNGKNNWYVSEPQFELSNPDAINIFYRWNGFPYLTYFMPFGLERAPNNANITGGTHVLYYWSDVCDEPAKQFLGRFDFKDPEIKNLFPENGAALYNDPPITIRAYIDEKYQGNSGVNLSSVKMEIDGLVVPASVNASGQDAEVIFVGNLSNGEHTVAIYAEDKSGRSSFRSWSFELVTPVEFDIFINFPVEGIYPNRRTQFNISMTRKSSELSYINHADTNPSYKRLCRDCNEFGAERAMFKSLREGENILTFRAEISGESVIEKSISLTIDSTKPKILTVLPQSGLASGKFEIEFEEEKPSSLLIYYGNSLIGFKTHEINISSECRKNSKYSCTTYIDLTDYDGTQIEYSVSLKDLADNAAESRARILEVDLSEPLIESFEYEPAGRFATLTIKVHESHLEEISYINYAEAKPREMRLCNSLQNNLCTKKIFVNEGENNISVFVRDKAGNVAVAHAHFFTDSKLPRIKRTEPTRGFTIGEFTVLFEESNPLSLFLNYGNTSEIYYSELKLSTCTQEKKNFLCKISVNLSRFEEQDIFYWFNLTDRAFNTAESKSVSLKVDTAPPKILDFNYTQNGIEYEFIILIEDENFLEAVYLDRTDPRPQPKTLCNRLLNGACIKKVRFRPGYHVLDIIARDKADNEAVVAQALNFFV